MKELEEQFEERKLMLKQEEVGEEVEERWLVKGREKEEDSDDDFEEEMWMIERNLERC